MCCLFGILDYKQTLNQKQLNKIIAVLSKACELRGTDEAYRKSLDISGNADNYSLRIANSNSIEEIKDIILNNEKISKTTENTITNPPIDSNVLTPLNIAFPNKTKKPL